MWLTRSLNCGRDADHLASGKERGVAGRAALVGGQAVAAEMDVAVNAAVGGQESLGMAG